MGNYNPNSPCVMGPEWFPYRDSVSWFDAESDAFGSALVANTNDTISELYVHVCSSFGDGCFSLEVFDITGDVLPTFSDLVTTSYYPGGDLYVSPRPNLPGCYGAFSGYAAWDHDYWQAINNPVFNEGIWPNSGRTVYDDSFIFALYGKAYEYICQFDGIAGTQAGNWITCVQLWANVNEFIDFELVGPMNIVPELQIAGTRYRGPSTTINGEQPFGQEVVYQWYGNPRTGLPWTPGDIDKFDATSGSNWGAGWRVGETGSANNMSSIVTGRLDVISAPTDERIVMGGLCPRDTDIVLDGMTSSQGWQRIRLRDPADSSTMNLSLTAGNKYLFLFRRSSGEGQLSLCRTENPEWILPGPPHWTGYEPEMAIYGSMPGKPTPVAFRPQRLGEEKKWAHGMALKKAGGGYSMDSQVYISTSPTGGTVDAWPYIDTYFYNSPVNTTRSIQQEYTAPANDDYGWLRIMVCQHANVTDGDLVVELKRRSDDALMATWTITEDDMKSPVRQWQIVGKATDTGIDATLASGTQYYIDITSDATSDFGWHVQVLNGGTEAGPPWGPPAGADEANYGDDTDVATIDGTEEDFMDVAATIATIPEGPSNFTASASGETCGIDFITLMWEAPDPLTGCESFYMWEIQRSDDGGTTWNTIAEITDWYVDTFDDYESIRNSEAQYRVRLVRTDGAASSWTAIASDTAEQTEVGVLFTSNESPELTVFYKDIERERVFDFPENITFHQPHNRNYQVAFREIEDRGTVFEPLLLIRGGENPCVIDPCYDFSKCGEDVFAPIKEIARAGLSYVAVHNECGNRWFANVQTPQGTWRVGKCDPTSEADTSIYTMRATVTEVTDVSSKPDVSSGGAYGSGGSS